MLRTRAIPFLLTLLVLAAAQRLRAQDESDTASAPSPSPPVINGFAVFGNETTKPEIILRELSLKVGDTIDVDDIEYAKSRIYSLGLFNRVDITWPPLDSTILLIEVDERWFLYPVPIIAMVDRDWEKWNFGSGVKHENLRGRNEKLFVGGAIGYNPWASLSYGNPWVLGEDGQKAWFSETSLGYSMGRTRAWHQEAKVRISGRSTTPASRPSASASVPITASGRASATRTSR